MRNSRSVPYAPNLHIAADCFHCHLSFKIARFNAEIMVSEFPKIKTKADNDSKLRMNAGKVPGNYRIESSHDGKLPSVFLGEIAKSKKFYFNMSPHF